MADGRPLNFALPDTLPHDHGASYELKDSSVGKGQRAQECHNNSCSKVHSKFNYLPRNVLIEGVIVNQPDFFHKTRHSPS